jgi:hypothetical protein
MNLCSEDHDEVCFDVPFCPVCELTDDRDDEIKALKKEIEDLRYRLKAEYERRQKA